MRSLLLLLLAFPVLIVDARGLGDFYSSRSVIRGESGVKVGTATGTRGSGTGRGTSGIRIGEGRSPNSTRTRILPSTTTTTTTTPQTYFIKPPSAPQSSHAAKNQSKIFLKVCTTVKYFTMSVCIFE